MAVDTPVPPRRSAVALLLLVVLLIVLTVSRDVPLTDDSIGIRRLVLKTRWATAWVLLRYVGVLPAPSARQLVGLDPGLQSDEAIGAAEWLASNGRPAERMRWASTLTLRSPSFAPRLRPAIDAGLRSGHVECDVVQHAHRAVARLPAGSRQRSILQSKLRALASRAVGPRPGRGAQAVPCQLR
jgi:hypothetical protein